MQAAPVQLPPAGSHASGRSYHAARRGPCRRPLRVCAYLEPAPVATAGNKAEAPVIDAQGFLAPERDGAPPPADVAAAIKAAGAEAGCFQLVNHGISLGLIGDMQHEARRFFKLPLEQKLQVKRTTQNPNGFFNDEFTKRILDIKQGFDFCYEPATTSAAASLPPAHAPVLSSPNQWPEGEEEFRSVLSAYFSEMSRVSFKLLQAFSLGLGLPPDAMHHLFQDDHSSFMRLNWYPATPPSQQGLGLNHHTDAGFLTILVQDPEVHGLQFHKHGQWNSVTPAPDALTINVGDQCQVLTNDLLKAPVHRVLSPHSQARLSAPFFFNPRLEAIIEPLAPFVTPDTPAVYKPIPWSHFRNLRYAGDYQDQGVEVQIYHFKR